MPFGSWYVKTRALAFQPWFDAGFPHGYDQWISAAGTNWAAMALTLVSAAGNPDGRWDSGAVDAWYAGRAGYEARASDPSRQSP